MVAESFALANCTCPTFWTYIPYPLVNEKQIICLIFLANIHIDAAKIVKTEKTYIGDPFGAPICKTKLVSCD